MRFIVAAPYGSTVPIARKDAPPDSHTRPNGSCIRAGAAAAGGSPRVQRKGLERRDVVHGDGPGVAVVVRTLGDDLHAREPVVVAVERRLSGEPRQMRVVRREQCEEALRVLEGAPTDRLRRRCGRRSESQAGHDEAEQHCGRRMTTFG
jgi:hypothetical protein